MEIKKEEIPGQPHLYKLTVTHHDLAAALTNIIPTQQRDEGYIIDGNSFKTDNSDHITRVEFVLHQSRTARASAAGEQPTASDVQRMSAGINPRLKTEEGQE